LPLTERKLIERIRRLAQQIGKTAVVRGIGDDCAILRVTPGHQLLITTDLCIENVHFRREWHPPASVGYRCLARGLSDIAAMGGEPLACFLSLGLPPKLPQRWVDDFFLGLRELGRRFRAPLAGGDVSAAREITADIVVAGQAPSGQAVLRSGAHPGDRIYVTGDLGNSAAVLKRLYEAERVQPARRHRHFYPEPRLEAGRWLRRRRLATSMIDVSDGLSVDLAHICQESHVAAAIYADAVPVARGANLELALHGGDDYELLFTASAKVKVPAKIARVPVTAIGVIHRRKDYKPAIQILDENGKVRVLGTRGWQHFAKKSDTSSSAG
jgi:thiamine-monophosphate kinase